MLLRQRKLIFYLYGKKDFVTSNDLSEYLKVSDRTVRSDVNDINHQLNHFQISIESQRGKGYRLIADNEQVMHEIMKTDENFMTREDRIRYLAIKLIRVDSKVNVNDLEDEMFVSIATIERDIQEIKRRFVESAPFLTLNREEGRIWFEDDEFKKRILLNNLLSADWNYDAKDNCYYKNDYIGRQIFDSVLDSVNKYFRIYNIQMNDSSLVSIIYSIAIAYKRIQEGHTLKNRHELQVKMLPQISEAVNETMDSLEIMLSCSFDEAERFEIAWQVLNNNLPDVDILTKENVSEYIDRDIIDAADLYLASLKENFHLNFYDDDEFYFTLLLHIRGLQNRMYAEQNIGLDEHLIRETYLFEYELALLFQGIAQEHFGFYLNETELLYLAVLMSGAVKQSNPPIRVLIICHLNSSVKWMLKRNLQWHFNGEIEILDAISVYEKQKVKAESIDLILSTAKKKIVTNIELPFIEISPLLSGADLDNIRLFINRKRDTFLWGNQDDVLKKLFDGTMVYEDIEFDSKQGALKFLADRMSEQGYCRADYYDKIVERDRVSPLAFKKGIVLAYTIAPCAKTGISFALMRHRFLWNEYKTRILCMLTMRPEDYSQLYDLLKLFYKENGMISASDVRTLKTLLQYLFQD